MSEDDIEIEPIPGLPAHLPAGEEIIWQGRPDSFALACQALWLPWVAAYFLVLAIWRYVSVSDLLTPVQAFSASIPFLLLGFFVCALLYSLAVMQARATMYTLTNRRVVLRIGAALNLTLNIPFREVANAALDLRRDGTGTIALQTDSKTKLSYMMCWPHLRPWHFNPAQPALRCIPDAARVAQLVAEAAQTRMSEPRVTLRTVAAE
jgi:hypothetical protein